jgi:signal transduction histidine kinase
VNEAAKPPARTRQKWRPNLSLVVLVVLATVLSLPLVGLYFFRIDENQLVHQTEAELIAEGAVLVPVFQREIERSVPESVPLGAAVEKQPDPTPDDPYRPILPALDLGTDELLGLRPDARAPAAPADPAFLAVGARLSPILVEAQRVTLSGFRLLDPQGVVIAGRGEIGQSLAHVEEVADALHGHFRSVLRGRVFEHEPPPLYSVSRGTGTRIFVAMPVFLRFHVAGVIYLSRTPSNVMKQLYGERKKVALAGITIVGLTLLIGFVFHRAITRPVRELITRTTAIANGDRAEIRPLAHHGTAELAQLSQSFLDMATALYRRADFISTFAAHLSHELKSPLTSIKGAAELLRDDLETAAPGASMTQEEHRRFLDNIIDDTARLATIAQRLRDLARAENPTEIGVCTLSMVSARLEPTDPALHVEAIGDLDCRVRMSEENLSIILGHLIDNAAQHGATRVRLEALASAGMLRLTISDDGAGISPNNRHQIFDSFFTTRREAGGTGMGLPIVRAMLVAHGGTIELMSSPTGAAFALAIPCVTPSPEMG